MLELVHLVYKDVVAARWFLLAGLPIYALQLVTLDASPPAAMAVTVIFSAGLALGSLVIEESQGTEVTWCSLPVGRGQLVLARYLTTTIGVLLGLGLSWVISRDALGVVALAGAFFMLQITAALFFPCYFRLGVGKGLAAFALVWLGIVVAITAASALLAAASDRELVPDEERIAALSAWFTAVEPMLAGGLILLALAASAASAMLAARWYASRDC